MSSNGEVAELFLAIADLLDLRGERFKPDAYRRAARSLVSLGEDLRKVAERGALEDVPGVGEALREKILEYLKEGRISYYERLKGETPPGVLALVRIPGIGPKTTARFQAELHIDSPKALLAAIDAGQLNGMVGFGERKIAKLRQALLQSTGSEPARRPLRVAWELAASIVRELSRSARVETIEVAGSLRRRRETIGDLDLLATSADPPKVIEAFVALPGVQEIVLKGDTKATVVRTPGIQVDLRVVEPESFGAALQYFTGSKDHNIHLRTLARGRGLKINEYGVFRGDERIAGRAEADVYATLGLPWIPPELRENQGEVEAAIEGRLPTLVGPGDLRGELHRHAPEGTDRAELRTLASLAARRRFEYLGLVLRAERASAVSAARITQLRAAWPREPSDTVKLLVGVELPLRSLSRSDALPAGVDYVVATGAGGTGGRAVLPPEQPIPAHPLFLGHMPLGGSTSAPPPEVQELWLAWATRWGVAFEVSPDGPDDGPDSGIIRRVTQLGTPLTIGAGDPWNALDALDLAVGVARRAWATPASVLNTRSAQPLLLDARARSPSPPG